MRIRYGCAEEPESRFSGSFYLCIFAAMVSVAGQSLWMCVAVAAFAALPATILMAATLEDYRFSKGPLICVQSSDADQKMTGIEDPIVAPVKRMAPQMPANVAKPSAKKSDDESNVKRDAPAKKKQSR